MEIEPLVLIDPGNCGDLYQGTYLMEMALRRLVDLGIIRPLTRLYPLYQRIQDADPSGQALADW
jgi:hypothetical protein